MSQRTEQLGSVLQRAVQMVIERGLSDPRIRGVITVIQVRVSPDLKRAIVLVSVMPAEREKTTLHGLRSAARHIRRRAAEHVALHQLPELDFRVDEQIKKEANVLTAINQALAQLNCDGAGAEDESPGTFTPTEETP